MIRPDERSTRIIGFATTRAEGPGDSVSTSRGGVAGGETSDKVGGELDRGRWRRSWRRGGLLVPGVGRCYPVASWRLFLEQENSRGVAAAGALAGAATGIGAATSRLASLKRKRRLYENEFNQGRVPVTVKADNRYDEISAISCAGGARVKARVVCASTTSPAPTRTVPTSPRPRITSRERAAPPAADRQAQPRYQSEPRGPMRVPVTEGTDRWQESRAGTVRSRFAKRSCEERGNLRGTSDPR